MKRGFFCTIGPASFNEKVIRRLDELGVDLFRINLSHTKLEDIEGRIELIRRYSRVPICLDTEGAQIRTGFLSSEKRIIKENDWFLINSAAAESERKSLSLYPASVINELEEGDILSIDFDAALIQIVEIKDGQVKARVISSGGVGNNKAVTSLRPIHLPALTEKDREAIQIGKRLGVGHYALSFANYGKDVEMFRELVPMGTQIISKIESRSGYKHLEDILAATDMILIDRGDLSREIPIEMIPFYQKKIIEKANKAGKPVYVATNLLESMTENPYPTRAEVNDVINALTQGADGLILAGETAIGKHPVATAAMIVKLINQYELSCRGDIVENASHVTSSLIEPHGGLLIDRRDREPDWKRIEQLDRLKVPVSAVMDGEQIGIGTYSPLEGFMTRKEVHSVLDTYRLPGGVVWTLPIVLQRHREDVLNLITGDTVALVSEDDGEIYVTLDVEDVYEFPFEEVCQKWFGTLDMDHPGVERLKISGEFFIGGKITLLKQKSSSVKMYEFTPEALRHIFDSKGWSRVVGFHTRNVVHRAHEAIQKLALSQTHCDGLLISPVIGEKKSGDFTSEVLLRGYQLMVDKGYFKENTVLISAFSTYSRYSGAREAVFTALCRKNFGCSHFIVGRDHAGVGGFYKKDSARELFKLLGDIGITPVFFDEIKFCATCRDYVVMCDHDESQRVSISGTQVRKHLANGELPPPWAMRQEISTMIIEEKARGKDIFVL